MKIILESRRGSVNFAGSYINMYSSLFLKASCCGVKISSILFMILMFGFLFLSGKTMSAQEDSLRKSLQLSSLREDLNIIEYYQRKDFSHFVDAWKNSRERKVSVVHLGDSHIQGGFSTAVIRKALQDTLGTAGWGMIFPYSVPKSYSPFGYRSVHTGKWDYSSIVRKNPPLPHGISGYTIRTQDTAAGFTIIFKQAPEESRYLQVFCKICDTCFDFTVSTGGVTDTIRMQSFKENPVPCIGLDLMKTGDSITLRVLKSDTTQKVFELYGMSLETRADTGLVYHAPGIGSAQFTAVLEEELLDFQLPLLKPDLVILDFGTNDIFKMRHPDEDLINRINLAIDRIRNAAPEATLMLTSTQDMYNRKRHITSPEWFSGLIRGIAKEKSCVFYDWYQVSGGSKTVKEWLKKGLTQPDRVHLSGKGYRLKGQLFAEALKRSVKWHIDHPESDSLVNILSINKLSNDTVSSQNLTKMNTEIVKPVDRKSSKTFLLYKVQPGDTLGLIAQKHRVSIAELKKWNGIRGSLIRSGQKIKIYSKTKV